MSRNFSSNNFQSNENMIPQSLRLMPFISEGVSSMRVITQDWISFVATHIIGYPTPKFLNYFWSFGSLLGLGLVIQIITGIVLAKHYTANIEYAFFSVEHIMRDVNYGYIVRYTHANGSSMLFILLYLHMFRGIFYGSYVNKMLLWWSGVVLFLLMMGTAFLGYVLPWGQMSFWGATVITNLASAIPFVGESIVKWLWGGFSISNATLVRFFAYHYALPFAILGLVILHLAFLHAAGSSNSLGSVTDSYIPFFPYFYVKDLFAFLCYVLCISILVFFYPNMLGHPDNYILANPMVTPAHIVPEWYFLPFYAILRSIPNKLLGVFGMVFAILILCLFPVFINNFTLKSSIFRPVYQMSFYFFVSTFVLLGWLGQKSATMSIVLLAQQCTTLYFVLLCFMFSLPCVNNIEVFFKNFDYSWLRGKFGF